MKNRYEVRGAITAIFLYRKNGTIVETLIDTTDLERAQEFDGTWGTQWNSHTKSLYVIGQSLDLRRNGVRKTIRLHRYLMGIENGRIVDHINHDTLDNRRSSNLRIVSHSENALNRKSLNSNNTSGVRGVTWNSRFQKWQAKVNVNGKRISLGYYKELREAELAVKAVMGDGR